jgi:hypothetical protein
MKNTSKVIAMLLCLASFQSVFADDADIAKLKIKLSGPVNNNAYYLCVSNNGCSRISAAAKGEIFMMDTGSVNYIFAANMRNFTMRSQALPESCKVSVAKNQTLTVSGKIVVKNDSPYIDGLTCKVS